VPVVLIHGGGINNAAISWGRSSPISQRDRQVLALDLPGFGATGLPIQNSPDLIADQVIAIVRAAG
jgi:pimeloyl-ACP methyl ester carboxylesterase